MKIMKSRIFATVTFLSTMLSIYAQGLIVIDHKTQKYIGNSTTFDRDKYVTAHVLYTGTDALFEAFKQTYNIKTSYNGSRQFWNPLGKVNKGVIPTIKKVYSGVREVDPFLVATGGASSLMYDNTADYSTIDISEQSKNAAEYVAKCYRDEWDLVPTYIEPFNEPMVHANEFYPEGRETPIRYVTSKTDDIITKICQYHSDLGKAIHAIPELSKMKVTGFASAYPEFENNDFDTWITRYKKFIDIAGSDLDVFSLHLYDGTGVNNSGGRRSGSNSEAILDLVQAYSFIKLKTVKPIAITEYGRLVPNQADWTSSNGKSNYEAVENSQAVRSQIHFAMSFIERGDELATTIPFNVNTPNTSAQYSKSSIWIKNQSNQYELTQRRYFYEMWKDIKGDRVRINSSNIDVQTQAFVNDKQLYVILNNLNDNTQNLNLKLLNTTGLQNVNIKRLNIFLDKTPELTESVETAAPESISLQYGETVVLTYNFDSPISFENKIYSNKFYAEEYLSTITANTNNNFTINAVEIGSGYGEATLRVGVGRNLGLSLMPTIIINGKNVVISGDIIRGYDQSNRKQFFGTLEIPVDISYLNEGTNNVVVKFSDNGGRISSVILQVQKAEKSLNTVNAVKDTNNYSVQLFKPTIVKSGETVTVNSEFSDSLISVYNTLGLLVQQGNDQKIQTTKFLPGIYIISVNTNGKIISDRLIVN